MHTWRRILCPTDFSPASRPAVEAAATLARRLDGELTLVHVYQIPGWGLPEGVMMAGPETMAKLLDSIETELARLKKEILAAGPLKLETATALGAAHTEITRLAREQKFDLIVMGTHGRTGISHALIGSVAERVVRHADCAVLTIRAREGAK